MEFLIAQDVLSCIHWMTLGKLKGKLLAILVKSSKKASTTGVFFLLYKYIKLNYMKSLKDYVNESVWDINESYLNESVWDIEDNIEDDNKEFALNGIKKFIDDKYYDNLSQYCEYIYDDKRGKYIVNLKGKQTVMLKEEAEQLTNGSFEWGIVGRAFNCCECPKLESLEGAPKYVGWSFVCSECPKLENLEGAPQEVGGDFICRECPKLENLEGAPEKVDGAFVCNKCIGLKNLKGAPKTLKHYFDCNECPNLETLEGAPKKIGGVFTKK